MRNLSVDEINFVSGGEDIVVTANTSHKYDNNSIPAIFSASMAWASAYGQYLIASGGGGISHGTSQNIAPKQGDGVVKIPKDANHPGTSVVVLDTHGHYSADGSVYFDNQGRAWESLDACINNTAQDIRNRDIADTSGFLGGLGDLFNIFARDLHPLPIDLRQAIKFCS